MKKIPTLCIQREKGRADRFYCWLKEPDGKRKKIFFGPVTDPSSRAKYETFIKERTERPPELPRPTGAPLIAHLIGDFMKWARVHYLRDGELSGRVANYWTALKPFLLEFGGKACDDFTLDDLEAYQRRLDESGRYCRRMLNQIIRDIQSVFRWGVRHRVNGARYVQPSTAGDLAFIESLRRGACHSIDHPRRLAANIADVEKTLPYMSAPVQSLVQIILYTGARPGEILALRPCDVTPLADDLWEYRPQHHKTERYGGDRVIYLGPRAIEILRADLSRYGGDPSDYLYRPKDALPPRWTNPRYNRQTLANAVRAACDKAGVKRWSPYQLRKAAATIIDKEWGAEGAAAVLGHRSSAMTEAHYIDPRLAKAAEIARKIG